MIINFNYKKFFKYVFICLFVILLSNSCDVKALSNGKIANIITYDNQDFTTAMYKGNELDFISYYDVNFNFDINSTFISDIHNYILTQNGYSTWENFSNDYYYILAYFPNINGTGKGVNAKFYAREKTSGTFDLAFSVNSDTRSNPGTSYNTNIYFAPNVVSTDLDLNYSFSFGNINSYSFSSNNYGSAIIQTSCSGSSTSCSQQYDSTSGVMRVDFYKYIHNGGHPLFYDYNFNFNFVFNEIKYTTLYSSYYSYSLLDVNGTGTNGFNDVLGGVDFFTINSPNIQDLGNNSYGINVNTISNVFLDFTGNSSTSITCPNDTPFANNTCYLYNSDIDNFDSTNTNVSNSAIWYIGDNNTISLDSSKYYVLTFRLYTDYNLDILTTIYHLTNDNTDRPFNILSKYMSDNSLYKDYSIVFQPTHSGTGYLKFFDIVFSNLSNFTNDISSSSFGIFKSIKISEFSSEPTSSVVENELNNNSLTTISNNNTSSFFSDFRLDDHGLSSIVLYPLNFATSFVNYTCSPITLPIPKIGNVSLPCVSSFMSSNFLSIWELYRLVFNGFIIYRILINIYSSIKNAYNPDNDRIEVVDL